MLFQAACNRYALVCKAQRPNVSNITLMGESGLKCGLELTKGAVRFLLLRRNPKNGHPRRTSASDVHFCLETNLA